MTRPKNRDKSMAFICIGEKFKNNVPMGDCEDVKTLMEWLIYLTNQDKEYLDIFFDDSYTNTDIVDYIYQTWGKRLEEV